MPFIVPVLAPLRKGKREAVYLSLASAIGLSSTFFSMGETRDGRD